MRKIVVVQDLARLAQQAADIILESARDAHQSRGKFSLCLAGGSTPRGVYRRLAMPEFISTLVQKKTAFYWGDERCVSPHDPESNYGMAHAELLSHLPNDNPPDVYRIHGELDHALAASDYNRLLHAHFPDSEQPTFDLLLLGMGEDGHTASIFPHTAAVEEKVRLAMDLYVTQKSCWRITLTPPVLNRARKVLFLIAGTAKASTLARVLTGPDLPRDYPAQLVRPGSGELIWLVDRTAASMLPASLTG